MENTYWLKQAADKPLFPELLWSRPENKKFAGKLLIIGGNAHGFSAPAEAYNAAEKAGIGTVRVILPGAIQKLVGGFFENAFFAPSTPSGSFSQRAVAEFIEQAEWADAVLIAGDLGRNSETAIAMEALINKYKAPLILTKDAADYFKDAPKQLIERPNTTLVISLAQLQKLVQNAGFEKPVTFDMSLIRLVEALHEFTALYKVNIIVKHLDQIVVACAGQVSTTHLNKDREIWRVQTAAFASVWWLQNSTKPFEALTTSLVSALEG